MCIEAGLGCLLGVSGRARGHQVRRWRWWATCSHSPSPLWLVARGALPDVPLRAHLAVLRLCSWLLRAQSHGVEVLGEVDWLLACPPVRRKPPLSSWDDKLRRLWREEIHFSVWVAWKRVRTVRLLCPGLVAFWHQLAPRCRLRGCFLFSGLVFATSSAETQDGGVARRGCTQHPLPGCTWPALPCTHTAETRVPGRPPVVQRGWGWQTGTGNSEASRAPRAQGDKGTRSSGLCIFMEECGCSPVALGHLCLRMEGSLLGVERWEVAALRPSGNQPQPARHCWCPDALRLPGRLEGGGLRSDTGSTVRQGQREPGRPAPQPCAETLFGLDNTPVWSLLICIFQAKKLK